MSLSAPSPTAARTWLLLLALALGSRPMEASAEPRRLNEWRLRCATDRGEIEDALGPAQSTRVFADLDGAGRSCRILAGSGGPCASARAEMLATLLNVGAGRVSASACVVAGEELRPLSTLVSSADTWLFRGCTSQQCERIVSGLRGVNDGSRLSACEAGRSAAVPGAPDEPAVAELAPAPAAAPEPAPPVDAAAPAQPIPLPAAGQAPQAAIPEAPVSLLPPADACCDPRAATAWQRACTLSGKWTTLTQLLDNDNLRDFGMSTCAALAIPDIDPREESRRQLIALRLNVRSGYLAPTCTLADSETVEQAGRRAFAARQEGRFAEARDIALDINEARALIARMPCPTPAQGLDLVWEPAPVVEPAPEPKAPAPRPAAAPRRRPRG